MSLPLPLRSSVPPALGISAAAVPAKVHMASGSAASSPTHPRKVPVTMVAPSPFSTFQSTVSVPVESAPQKEPTTPAISFTSSSANEVRADDASLREQLQSIVDKHFESVHARFHLMDARVRSVSSRLDTLQTPRGSRQSGLASADAVSPSSASSLEPATLATVTAREPLAQSAVDLSSRLPTAAKLADPAPRPNASTSALSK